ncbi:hypothetical protein RB597_005700 [Gaeumannomyces tritici]
MFWAGMRHGLKSNLVPLEGDPLAPKGGVTARIYIEVLQEYLPTLLDFDTIFMQDNAPIHKARATLEFLFELGVKLLQWPPYSPDFNPIENLWAILKDKLQKSYPGLAQLPNNDQAINLLIKKAEEVWEDILEELVNELVDSMPRRVQAVFDANGWYTKY